MGNYVSFPIKMKQSAWEMPILGDYQKQLTDAFCQDFKPHTTTEKVNCVTKLLVELADLETHVIMPDGKKKIGWHHSSAYTKRLVQYVEAAERDNPAGEETV